MREASLSLTPPTYPSPKLYRINVVTKMLSISRATIYRMVTAGDLKLIKIGKRSSGITAESIEAILARVQVK